MASHPRTHLRRLAGLVGCVAAGALVGFVGRAITGSDFWYLAIPLLIAIAWLFVANPTACERPTQMQGKARPGDAP
ncbi:MAG: hypothetical protein ACM3JC_03515 [Rudaea sp.]